MEYLAVNKEEYHILDDGLTFKVLWDSGRNNFRFDFMSITEGKKTDPSARNIYGSVHLRDLLLNVSSVIKFDYFAQNATNLRIVTQGMQEGIYDNWTRGSNLIDIIPRDYEWERYQTEGNRAQARIKTLLSIEQKRLNAVALATKRASYRVAFSSVTSNSIVLTASGGPAGATGDWDLQFRIQGRNTWQNIPAQSGENAHIFTLTALRAGTAYEFEVRRGTEPWSDTFTRILPQS